jgi:protein-S-isoprenylcysteine O-methyltransferase Ste14
MMHESTAAVGSAMFFVAAPGTVVGLIPWLITRWQIPDPTGAWWMAQACGALLIVAGLIPAVAAFVEFAKAGGTPMPLAPTQHLVVSGFNRYVRNPMYVGLLVAIIGQALLFGSLAMLAYAALGWIVTASFVRWYEEPTLARRYGSEYEAYRRNVPAWIPRWRPWTPARDPQRHQPGESHP